jgi:hypothetical protein
MEAAVACLLGTALAAIVLIPGLGIHGLWSDGELAVLDRSRAALGEPLGGLERSPWLPDTLRTFFYEKVGGDLGLRLPGAIAGCLIVGITALLGRVRGGSRRHALFSALFALSFPALLMSSRTVLGNPIGELTGILAIALGLGALSRLHIGLRIAFALLGLGALTASIASTGVVVGGVLPTVVLALVPGKERWRRWLSVGLWISAIVAGGVAIYMALEQGDGYIPLLGSAKDAELMSDPHRRGFAASLEELGFAVFPWLPLALAGALNPARDRWPAVWLIVGAAIITGWSMVYGATPLPLTVPTALCCATGLSHILDPSQTRVSRRFAVLLVAAGLLIMGKDAKREPHRVGSPLHYFPAGLDYPDDRIGSDRFFGGDSRVALLLLFAAFAVSPRSRRDDPAQPGPLARLGDRIPEPLRRGLPLSLMGALLAAQSLHFGRVLIARTSEQLSAKAAFQRHVSWVERGLVPSTFVAHRVRDPGVAAYGPDPADIVTVSSRSELTKWISVEEPAVALIRRSELAPLHAKARQNPWNLYVLDESHHDLVFVANYLPDGMQDQNPLHQFVLDTPPQLENETLLRFEKYVEVIGWEFDGPIVRGQENTLRVLLRPLRHLPAGTQIYARLQKRRMSRINHFPQDLVNGLYPPNNWREGDYILHEFQFEVPTIEILSGEHDFIIGLRRSESKNYSISLPEGEQGEFGVRIKGKKREFAYVGLVDVL